MQYKERKKNKKNEQKNLGIEQTRIEQSELRRIRNKTVTIRIQNTDLFVKKEIIQ